MILVNIQITFLFLKANLLQNGHLIVIGNFRSLDSKNEQFMEYFAVYLLLTMVKNKYKAKYSRNCSSRKTRRKQLAENNLPKITRGKQLAKIKGRKSRRKATQRKYNSKACRIPKQTNLSQADE